MLKIVAGEEEQQQQQQQQTIGGRDGNKVKKSRKEDSSDYELTEDEASGQPKEMELYSLGDNKF